MARGVTLVTGASAGLGAEFARQCRRRGDELVLVARRKDRLEALAAELGSAHVIASDLARPGAPERLLAEVAELGLEVETLINNAGFGAAGSFVEAPPERLLEMIDLNVRSLTGLCRLALPPMLERRRGFVLNVASTAAFLAGPYSAVYYATKAYVLSLSEALHEEAKGSGVHVTALCPGPTATGFAAAADMGGTRLFTMRKPAASDEVARVGYEAMKRGRRVVITGLRNKIMAQSVRFAPRRLVNTIVRKIQEPS